MSNKMFYLLEMKEEVSMLSVLSVRDKIGVSSGRLYIDGRWHQWEGPHFNQIHPSTNEIVANIPEAEQQGVNLAVSAARKAFDEGPWPRMSASERKRILKSIADCILENEEELAYLQTLDNGMPITYSRYSRFSGQNAASIFDNFSSYVDKINGETFPRLYEDSNIQFMTYREPIGVVAAILPWNGPIITFAMKVAPALASGCTIVVKPSELTNLVALRLTAILAESDLPPGVFNLVTGGAETGEALSNHPGVNKVTFTGSPVVGQKILSASGNNLKRVSLELGGKSAALVFPDTKSVKTAATTLMGLCSTILSGQICSTPTRALVHTSIMDEFLHYAQEQVKMVRFGDPFDPSTTSSPIITKRQMSKILGYIESGKEEGAKLLFGGDTPGDDLRNGNWINPTLFVDVNNKMRIAREEIFGPVLCVIPFETEEEAIRIANDSEYGLAGCIYTSDVNRAFRVSRSIRTGSIGINGYATNPNVPFGGVKMSGLGREGGREGIEAFTELKMINFHLDA